VEDLALGTGCRHIESPGLVDPEGMMWHDVPDVLMHATAAEVETEVRAQMTKCLEWDLSQLISIPTWEHFMDR